MPPRLLFASYHGYLDPSSGAAMATRDVLELLASHGWSVRVFCGPMLDFERGESLPQLLADQGIPFEERPCDSGPVPFSVFHFRQFGIPVTVFMPASAGGQAFLPSAAGGQAFLPAERGVSLAVPAAAVRPAKPALQELPADVGTTFLALFDQVLDDYRPQVVLTYGGQWVAGHLMRRARRRRIAVVFALHNFAYRDPALFQHASAILVPSQFSADYYRQTLGLDCTAIPNPLNWSHVRCDRDPASRTDFKSVPPGTTDFQSVPPGTTDFKSVPQRQYVTFVNPQPNKGLFVFARIAQELGSRRPDIPVLIVEGRGGVDWLRRTGLDLSGLKNLNRMANTPDPRDFYRVSRVVLMPSLWKESFGRVAAEAMINGIPVLASRRGALPEVLRAAGFLFDVPERYTPESRLVPSAEEIAPWVETILRLWDDAAFYEQESRRALAAAEAWRPQRLAQRYDAFFGGLRR